MASLFRKSKPKILMVEDELINHPLYREAFEAEGFDVVICQTADGDFLSEVKLCEPDLISMDLMIGKEGRIPDRDGFQAIELLNSDQDTANIPVIVLTNFFDDEKVERAKSLGAIDYVNAQGQPLPAIARQYKKYLKDPKHYVPSNEVFAKNV